MIDRPKASCCPDTDLSNLWQIIQEERANPEDVKYRRIEAEMGYEPDECPDEWMRKALELDKKMGSTTLSELAPVYGKSASRSALKTIDEIAKSPGLVQTAVSEMQYDYAMSGELVVPRVQMNGTSLHGNSRVPTWRSVSEVPETAEA